MTEKKTRAIGAGSMAIDGSVKNSTVSTNVTSYPDDQKSRRSRHGEGAAAEGPGAIAVVGTLENSEATTNVEIVSASYSRAGAESEPAEFPGLKTQVNVILRIAHTGSDEIRFDALDRSGRQVGRFQAAYRMRLSFHGTSEAFLGRNSFRSGIIS
jgi:hypothetical protein